MSKMKQQIRNKKTLLLVGLLLIFGSVSTLYVKRDATSSNNDVAIASTPSASTTENNKYASLEKDLIIAKKDVVTEKAVVQPSTENTKVSKWPITYTSSEAASISVVVNKKHQLPSSYAPALVAVAGGQLRSDAASALQNLLNGAQAAGNPMTIVSSYRSYKTQVSTYQYWVDTQGQVQADRESARPGHSEHQTGLAADLGNPDGSCRLLACFGSGTAGQWLATNASNYGFIIRYPEGKESQTGYIYEPWHIRYVGIDIATAIKNSGQTMDQYYGVEAGDY